MEVLGGRGEGKGIGDVGWDDLGWTDGVVCE